TSLTFENLSAVSLALICAVTAASSMTCPTVRACTVAVVLAMRARHASATNPYRRNDFMTLLFGDPDVQTRCRWGGGTGARHARSRSLLQLASAWKRRAWRADREIDDDVVALANLAQRIGRHARLERVTVGLHLDPAVAVMDVLDGAVDGLTHARRHRDRDGRRWRRLRDDRRRSDRGQGDV